MAKLVETCENIEEIRMESTFQSLLMPARTRCDAVAACALTDNNITMAGLEIIMDAVENPDRVSRKIRAITIHEGSHVLPPSLCATAITT